MESLKDLSLSDARKMLDELERKNKKKEHDGYLSVTVYSFIYRILGIILLVLNSITVVMTMDKSIRSMLFEYALEAFLVMSLYNDLVLISFWCNENQEKISEGFSTFRSWLSELVGWLKKCPAKPNKENKDDPKDVNNSDPTTEKKYDKTERRDEPSLENVEQNKNVLNKNAWKCSSLSLVDPSKA